MGQLFLTFCDWSDHTPVAEAIRNSVWLFPFVEIFHLLGLGLLGGTVLLWNFRLLDIPILKGQKLPSLVRELRGIMTAALMVMLISGYALFSSEALKDFYNWGFRLKMASLLLAIIFTYTIHRQAALSDDERPSMKRKATAIVSLFLWMMVGLGGRSIGYITGAMPK